MNEFVGRHPAWSLVIVIAAVLLVWLVFAPWPPGFVEIFGTKKLFLNASFNGITLGGLYFLVASGFTLIFGLMRNVNLAHGSIYLLGGYFGYMTSDATGSWLLSLRRRLHRRGGCSAFFCRSSSFAGWRGRTSARRWSRSASRSFSPT